jgi:hypothetical protein
VGIDQTADAALHAMQQNRTEVVQLVFGDGLADGIVTQQDLVQAARRSRPETGRPIPHRA